MISFDLERSSSEANETKISQALEQVFRYAMSVGKPVAMETLKDIKKELMYEGSTRSRKISMFAYNTISDYAQRKSYKHGVKLKSVNPAYTSQIGKMKYMKPFGISVHQAASYAIGRRAIGFRDPVPRYLSRLLPDAYKTKHSWSQWNYLTRQLKDIPSHNFYRVDPHNENITSVQELKALLTA